MIDLHMHILPGMDDGSSDLEESLMMAAISVRSGVHTIVATPHSNLTGLYQNYFSKRFYRNLQGFRHALERERIPLTVLSGMEIFTTEDTVSKMDQGKLISLNHSRYYLMEFDFGLDGRRMESRLHAVLDTGRVPLIAHPERYECIQEYPDLLYSFMEAGCLSQVNKGSLLGRFGSVVKETADQLMSQGLVTCVASDAHSPEFRTPFMAEIQDYLEDFYGYKIAKQLLYDNPLKILEDKDVFFHGIKRE